MLLSVREIEKQFGGEQVFSNISCTLDEGHKVALVGRNGAGKSTLIKIIAGLEETDGGVVKVTSGRTVSYLPQEIAIGDGRTGVAYIQDGTDLQPHQFFPVLEGLGVSQQVAAQKLSEMSGGQQTKVLLTRFLLEPSDILLLDEPTNNLDIPALLWLEAFLAASKKAMIIISHDLLFLNNVTNRVFELKNGALTIERGSYGDYLERKKKEFDRQMKAYTRHQEEVKRLEASSRAAAKQVEKGDALELSDSDKYVARAGMDKASASQRRAKVIRRRIQRIEEVEKPFEEEPFTLELEARQAEGDIEVGLDEVVAGYKDGISIGPTTLTVKMGERLCLMGMNGEGKSTVLKTIAGIVPPLRGTVTKTEGIVLGDLMQQHERAGRDTKAVDFFREQTSRSEEEAIYMLKKAGFAEQTMQQKVGGLSSGMRARLLFAVFIALGVNVLLLDEPTNHLDMEAITALKQMLKKYTGIVLLISHNRWFLEGVEIGTCYEVANGTVQKIKDIEQYIKAAQKRAEGMIGRLKRVLR
ncbi:MAG: ABC-F family ATP-binding cassette domain-containing protein [Candidatus Kaiserbacteria bacterium]|nr:ABC-F family ATP-binding cassette domain-containing protein [Candidatus Kaiserbacteria bacterium]